MLKDYTTKPMTVLACEITEAGKIEKIKTGVYKYTERGRGAASTLLEFTKGAKQKEPKVGDFIIRLKKDDIYLCDRETFLKKYACEGMKIK